MAKSGSTKIGGSTSQQKLFAIEYFANGGNATQAAIEAGYSKRSAHVTGSRLLNYAKVKQHLQKLTEQLEKKAIITKERVLEEYVRIGLFDLRTIYNENNALKQISELSDDAGASIAGIEVLEEFGYNAEGERIHIGNTVKIKLNNKLAALDSIRDTMGWKAPVKVAPTDADGRDKPTQVITLPNGSVINIG